MSDDSDDDERDIEEVEVPQAGQLWRHFRGGLYRVLGLARRESDGREVVVYEDAATGLAWVRDLCSWRMRVTLPGGGTTRRFARVEAPEPEYDKPAGRPVVERGPEH